MNKEKHQSCLFIEAVLEACEAFILDRFKKNKKIQNLVTQNQILNVGNAEFHMYNNSSETHVWG